MSVNPYSSPTAELETVSDAEREIRVVIRIYRLVGWVGSFIYVPMAISTASVLLYSLFARPIESPAALFFPACINLCGATVFVGYILIASRMARRSVRVRGKAFLLSYFMLLGFPLFTIVGIVCLRKLKRHYAVYCEEYPGNGETGEAPGAAVSSPADGTSVSS